MVSAYKYNDYEKEEWNSFNKSSKNSLFMFDRNYMDYHRDRFTDHSLIFRDDEGGIISILPACQIEDTLVSHGGLTFGGFISDSNMKQHTMNDCFDALISYARTNGINRIRYKAIPHIYHSQPAEEDRFSLYANGAKLVTIDASTYINLDQPLKMPKGRKAQISRAKREGVSIVELSDAKDFEVFIEIENEVLENRHDTRAAHTGAELKMLHDRFPDNIHLLGAIKDDKLIGGTVVYEYEQVVHTQYMATNEEARNIGALDLAIATVIDMYKVSKKWLDFGISTEHDRIYLNEGLISQKEGFGGRTGIYEIWELSI